jgi:hypothetical protein
MLALIEAAGFVDADPSGQPCLFRQFLQAGMQFAGSIASAGAPRRIRGPGVVANKDMAFEGGQFLLLYGGFAGFCLVYIRLWIWIQRFERARL